MEQIIIEQVPLVELLDRFLNEIGHRNEPVEPEPSVLSKPLPPNFHPIKFTRATTVHMGDIEAVIDGYIIDLFGCDHLIELRDFYESLFPRMRLYEYVMQICRYAEGHYLKNNEFFATTFTQWRQILSSADAAESVITPIIVADKLSTAGVKADKQKFGISGVDLDQLGSSTVVAKIRFSKVAEMLVQIAGLLRIPRITDGVPLRFMVSYMYVLLCDRIHLLGRFEVLLGQLKQALVQMNDQLVAVASLEETSAATKLGDTQSDIKESLGEQVTGDSLSEEA